MASATDIITYIGVPLAVLGVLPIIYTAIRTQLALWRFKGRLSARNLDGKINSHLVNGSLDLDTPSFELILLSRQTPEYWKVDSVDPKTSALGVSWLALNWQRNAVQRVPIKLHFSDKLVLPSARVEFRQLIRYLADLGCVTNPEVFFKLRKQERLDPSSCLMQQTNSNNLLEPILVVARQTTANAGNLVLCFAKVPLVSRNEKFLDVCYIPLAIPRTPQLKTNPALSNAVKVDDEIYHFKLSQRGITELKMPNGTLETIYGLNFWFTYCWIACSASTGNFPYNSQPCGFKMRLETLYFAQECALPVSGDKYCKDWYNLFLDNADAPKMKHIPTQWTESTSTRTSPHLTQRFKDGMTDDWRRRSRRFRQVREYAVVKAELSRDKRWEKISEPEIHLPIQALAITATSWSGIARTATQDIMEHLSRDVPPTPAQICVAVCFNERLRKRVAGAIAELWDWVTEKKSELSTLMTIDEVGDDKVAYLCAVIVLEEIAVKAEYLASLIDIEECASRWQTVLIA